MLLELENICVNYGDIQALWDVTIRVGEGEMVAIIGSNGAGKSTLLRTVSGFLRARSGTITFAGTDISGLSPDEIVRRGISQVPEGRKLFPDMSVFENLELGAAHIQRAWQARHDTLEWIFHLFPRLRDRLRQAAGTLSGGEQQMLAIGRALMSRPRLLMVDEPSLGLAPNVVAGVFQALQEINAQGVTVILVEQNVRRSLSMADRAYVLENGRVVMGGKGRDLLAEDYVRQAYLGL